MCGVFCRSRLPVTLRETPHDSPNLAACKSICRGGRTGAFRLSRHVDLGGRHVAGVRGREGGLHDPGYRAVPAAAAAGSAAAGTAEHGELLRIGRHGDVLFQPQPGGADLCHDRSQRARAIRCRTRVPHRRRLATGRRKIASARVGCAAVGLALACGVGFSREPLALGCSRLGFRLQSRGNALVVVREGAPLDGEFGIGGCIGPQPAQPGLDAVFVWRPDGHIRLAAVVACVTGARRAGRLSNDIVP